MNRPVRHVRGSATVVLVVTVIMGIVVDITDLFGFGNVLDLSLRRGVTVRWGGASACR